MTELKDTEAATKSVSEGKEKDKAPDNDGKEPVGRVNKGPFTLDNGATYTGQWLDG